VLERLPLAFDKFHPLQLKTVIDDSEASVEAASMGKAVEQLTGRSTVTGQDHGSKCDEIRDATGPHLMQG
jgi:hypothetical protein